MTLRDYDFAPGTLIRARGREWVVQPGSSSNGLRLRPFGGSDEDGLTLLPDLESQPPESAVFSWPVPEEAGNHDGAMLLRDALLLKLRSGAGPFRSFGNIAIEPRAYQLAPLLMALRLPTVRLLIADDVGIGKTIEAGLIVRELLDRGEISRAAVLCPPHLVDQWLHELWNHFHIHAVGLTASSVSRLEKTLPQGISLFDHHAFVVVSLDYIKSERHREHFLAIAPELIIVDEAHTCAASGPGKQLRFELLQRLSQDANRHLLLLTATPHSGDDEAFHHLLSLLKPDFAGLLGAAVNARHPLREELARHFVQRRRKDIEEWQDARIFPRRMTTEITYYLTGPWGDFFDRIQDYCIDLAERIQQNGHARHLIGYAMLALLRCVASSPAAAEKALTTRLSGIPEDMTALAEEDPETVHDPVRICPIPEEMATPTEDERLYDGQIDNLAIDDLEPPGQVEDSGRLKDLIAAARNLAGEKGDPKLAALVSHLKTVVSDGFRPVVFCRYIATAHYVCGHLKRHFPDLQIDAVTGELTPEEREERIQDMGESEKVVLVATDCLSEGINLQHAFNAVVHYDLAWNPTRHEQREGRVDRFGQKNTEVRCTMLYGQDNPVDGFILDVILRKAEAIRRELGVLVPLPQDTDRIHQALIQASLLKRSHHRKTRKSVQMSLDDFFPPGAALPPMETLWRDALEKAKANRTVFAQRRLKPEEVLPEWTKQRAILGSATDVARFVKNACSRLNAPLEPDKTGAFRLLPGYLPQMLRERLAQAHIEKPLTIDFNYPPAAGAHFIHRSHPVVSLLADTLIEGALTEGTPIAVRAAATVSKDIQVVTTIYLLRLRHQLSFTRKAETRTLMAEETAALAVVGRMHPQWLEADAAATLIDVSPSANLPPEMARREIRTALDFLQENRSRLDMLAQFRADTLLADHRRIREAARDIGSYSVRPCLPVDVMGVYVLLPDDL